MRHLNAAREIRMQLPAAPLVRTPHVFGVLEVQLRRFESCLPHFWGNSSEVNVLTHDNLTVEGVWAHGRERRMRTVTKIDSVSKIAPNSLRRIRGKQKRLPNQ